MMKVVVVTGGGRGIGAEITRNLLNEGMHVVIAEIDLSKMTIEREPQNLFIIKTDVKSESSVQKMIKSAVKQFGKIDCLINNAGILPEQDTDPEDLSLKTWNAFLDTNLTGPFLCAKYAIPYLRKQKGCILNIASTRALQSEGRDEAYSAAKGGLVSLTHALAVSLGPDIRVNCISPGWIHTETKSLRNKDHRQHPVGRVGKPEDIASLASFLISEKASFITGQNFIADGGMTVKMIYEE